MRSEEKTQGLVDALQAKDRDILTLQQVNDVSLLNTLLCEQYVHLFKKNIVNTISYDDKFSRGATFMCTVKPKQGNTTNLNISFFNEKRAAQVGFKPTTIGRTAHEADALPTELPRQLSWLGRIKAIQGQSNLT